MPWWPVYSALKAGEAQFSGSLSREVGPDGITVNCVAPGLIQGAAATEIYEPAFLEASKASNPIRRLGEAQDVANMVLFLASDEASFVTGQHISVDGGVSPY